MLALFPSAQRFVFNLKQVVGIEERALMEKRMRNLIRARMEGPGPEQSGMLEI